MTVASIRLSVVARDVRCPVRRCSGTVGAWCGVNGTPRADGFHDERWALADDVVAHLATLPTAIAAPTASTTSTTTSATEVKATLPVGNLTAARNMLQQAITTAARRGWLQQALAGTEPDLDDVVAAIALGTHHQQQETR